MNRLAIERLGIGCANRAALLIDNKRINIDDWEGVGVADKERRYVVLPVSLFVDLYHYGNHDALRDPGVIWVSIQTNDLRPAEPGEMLVIAM